MRLRDLFVVDDERSDFHKRPTLLARLIFLALLALIVIVATARSIPFVDSPAKFAKSLRAFLAARDANDPLSWRWTNSYSKNEAVFAYRRETMALYENRFKARCVRLATKAGRKDVREMCGTAHHPSHLKRLAEEFEEISEAEK